MTTPIKSTVGGKFKIEAIRPDGTRRVLADWFDNLVLDIGLDRVMATGVAISHARVGSGDTPPVASNVNMEAQIAATATTAAADASGNASDAPYYGWYRRTWRFAAGTAAGTIREVGVGWGAGANTLFSRALVTNTVGVPISLTVLADEVLDVTYELRLYAPTADVAFTFDMSGVTYNCVVRPSLVTSAQWQPRHVFGVASTAIDMAPYSGAINPLVTGRPSGTNTNGSSIAGVYAAGSFSRGYVASFALNAANFGPGGIRSCLVESYYIGTFQCSFDPPIYKDANKVLSLDFTYTIARHTP